MSTAELLRIDDLDELAFVPQREQPAQKRAKTSPSKGSVAAAASEPLAIAEPLPARARSSRRPKDAFSRGQVQRLFAFWCGNEEEGPCPVCGAVQLVRTERRTWDLAHICAWAKGGPCELWNLFPCCSACNQAAEMGGRRRGRQGVNHFEGIALDGFCDPARYGWRLGGFMDRAYEWLIVSGARARDRDVLPGEHRADIVEAWYGPGQAGGWSGDCGVGDAYREWLRTQQRMAALNKAAAEAEAAVAAAVQRRDDVHRERAAFAEFRAHYLLPPS